MTGLHRDPRERRHRMAAVMGGLPEGVSPNVAHVALQLEDQTGQPAEDHAAQLAAAAGHRDPRDGAVRLELALGDMRDNARAMVQHGLDVVADVVEDLAADLGPGYPPDYPAVPDHLAGSYAADVASGRTVAGAANLPAADASSTPPAALPAANLPAEGPPAHGGRVLAWASRHDPRSLEHLVADRLRIRVPVQDRAWAHGPILDQGTVPPLSLHDGSSCTGNMAVNLRNVLELATVSPYLAAGSVPMLTEDDARTIYGKAQQLDEWPGDAYPGTSVLAMMKAGQAAGWWDSYLWCKGTRDIAQAILQVGPVGIGVPFLEGMAAPDASGIVTATGRELGGHAMAVFALRRSVAGRPGPWFGLLQSYGPAVGDGGQLWIHHSDLARLLPGTGEAAVPIVAGMLA